MPDLRELLCVENKICWICQQPEIAALQWAQVADRGYQIDKGGYL